MKLTTATAIVLATAFSAFANAESAVNEAPVPLLAMNQTAATWVEPKVKAPVIEHKVIQTDGAVAELALAKVSEKLERQLEARLARDFTEQP